jgi:hypothetical protein
MKKVSEGEAYWSLLRAVLGEDPDPEKVGFVVVKQGADRCGYCDQKAEPGIHRCQAPRAAALDKESPPHRLGEPEAPVTPVFGRICPLPGPPSPDS